MKNLFKIWLVLVFGAILGALVGWDNGYVLIAAGHYTIEMSLMLLFILLCLGFVSFYFFIRLAIQVYLLPQSLHVWRHQRTLRLAQTAMARGLLEMSEGHWRKAERDLVRYADQAERPLLNYLSAARAAQFQGAYDRRDHYIRLAHENMPSADVAVSLTQAELQMADHQLEQALATLKHLRQVAPKHAYVLRLLSRLYKQLEDWEQLRQLIPELRRRKVETEEELHQLEILTYRALLKQATQNSNVEQLNAVWQKIPKALRLCDSIVADYVVHLQKYSHHVDTEKLLYHALNTHWDGRLIRLYGLLEGTECGKYLSRLEGFLVHHPMDSELLLALGRLSMQAKLWGKARGYLETCITQKAPPIEAYTELGQLLEYLGESKVATNLYRKALTAHDTHVKVPASIANAYMTKEAAPLTQSLKHLATPQQLQPGV